MNDTFQNALTARYIEKTGLLQQTDASQDFYDNWIEINAGYLELILKKAAENMVDSLHY